MGTPSWEEVITKESSWASFQERWEVVAGRARLTHGLEYISILATSTKTTIIATSATSSTTSATTATAIDPWVRVHPNFDPEAKL